jgi:small GTP-binding protein
MTDYQFEDFKSHPEPDESSYEGMNIFKVVFLGDSGVGKTNLMTRFASNYFNPNSKPTIGVDFSMKNVVIGRTLIRVQIWDTAGQERYQTFTNAYFKEAHGVIIVYDISLKESFENVTKWLDLARTHVDMSKVTMLLIGNKTDMDEQRQVGTAEGEDFARENGLLFMETSARTNENDCVLRAFFMILKGNVTRDLHQQPEWRERAVQ